MQSAITIDWFLLGGAVLTHVFAAVMWWQSRHRARHWKSASGRIIAFKEDSDGVPAYPVVEFIAGDGEHCEFTNDVAVHDEYRIDDSVTVLYDPNNRESGVIDDVTSMWLLPVIFLIAGTVFWFLVWVSL